MPSLVVSQSHTNSRTSVLSHSFLVVSWLSSRDLCVLPKILGCRRPDDTCGGVLRQMAMEVRLCCGARRCFPFQPCFLDSGGAQGWFRGDLTALDSVNF
jgi:hypothetical protein